MAQETIKGGKLIVGDQEQDRSPVTFETGTKWKNEAQNKVLGAVRSDINKLEQKVSDKSLAEVKIEVRAGDTLGALALAVDRAAKAKAKKAGKNALPDLEIDWNTKVEYYALGKDNKLLNDKEPVISCTLAECKYLYPGDKVSFEVVKGKTVIYVDSKNKKITDMVKAEAAPDPAPAPAPEPTPEPTPAPGIDGDMEVEESSEVEAEAEAEAEAEVEAEAEAEGETERSTETYPPTDGDTEDISEGETEEPPIYGVDGDMAENESADTNIESEKEAEKEADLTPENIKNSKYTISRRAEFSPKNYTDREYPVFENKTYVIKDPENPSETPETCNVYFLLNKNNEPSNYCVVVNPEKPSKWGVVSIKFDLNKTPPEIQYDTKISQVVDIEGKPRAEQEKAINAMIDSL